MNTNNLRSEESTSSQDLLHELIQLRNNIVDEAKTWLQSYKSYLPDEDFSKSAVNLSQYLMFRRRDLRELQLELAQLGFSSLGRAETHLVSSLDNVIYLLSEICKQKSPSLIANSAPLYDEGYEILDENTKNVFGCNKGNRKTRIIVTLPTHAATDAVLVKDLIRNGMDCARINTAHDNREIWAGMIENVHQACSILDKDCKILMELSGYKIRTKPIRVYPEVHHLKVKRNYFGEVVRNDKILIVPVSHQQQLVQPSSEAYFLVPVPVDIYRKMNAGDRLSFRDYRGKSRDIEIGENTAQGHWAASISKSAFLSGVTVFSWYSAADESGKALAEFTAHIPMRDNYKIMVHKGDMLFLSAADNIGHPPEYDKEGRVLKPASLAISLPDVLAHTSINDTVWIDDGKVGAVIVEKSDSGVLLEITHAGPKGAKIGAYKGVNFPDTDLQLPPLSEKDIEDLDFVSRYADMVGFSFVDNISDVYTLYKELEMRGASNVPVIAKIETKQAVRNLPEILLAHQSRHPFAIMIARGDLAVELGSVRLAEIQEEILWLCEAAHVPVIWATQVLESITKNGVRSRAEFTDAAMSVRAEGVMLNKGDYVLDALRSLSAILERMQDHQQKKNSCLRALHW